MYFVAVLNRMFAYFEIIRTITEAVAEFIAVIQSDFAICNLTQFIRD